MLGFVLGSFVVLHGLVHLWFFTLSQHLVPFQPAMGWTGRSWIFTNILGDATTRVIAGVLYLLATIGFVAGGSGLFTRQEWWPAVIVGSAGLSAATIILFWDGSTQLLIEKGLIGFLIDAAILIALLVLRWPSSAI